MSDVIDDTREYCDIRDSECRAKELLAEIAALRARIAAALDALRTASDLDTAKPSRAVLRRAHKAVSAAWAELVNEPASVRVVVSDDDA